MPRPTDVGYGDRLGIAYESVRDKIEKVIANPADTNSFFILGALDAMGKGFASNLRINGEAWQASKGPLHLYRGFTALVAGRYRQLREEQEGKIGLEEVEAVEARFTVDELRPSIREIEASRHIHNEYEHSIAANPVQRKCFSAEDWKLFLKARDSMAEKITGKRDGKLVVGDPVKLESQIRRFAQEAVALGWSLSGPETARMFWDLLPEPWQLNLKNSSSYRALLSEDRLSFENETFVPISRCSPGWPPP